MPIRIWWPRKNEIFIQRFLFAVFLIQIILPFWSAAINVFAIGKYGTQYLRTLFDILVLLIIGQFDVLLTSEFTVCHLWTRRKRNEWWWEACIFSLIHSPHGTVPTSMQWNISPVVSLAIRCRIEFRYPRHRFALWFCRYSILAQRWHRFQLSYYLQRQHSTDHHMVASDSNRSTARNKKNKKIEDRHQTIGEYVDYFYVYKFIVLIRCLMRPFDKCPADAAQHNPNAAVHFASRPMYWIIMNCRRSLENINRNIALGRDWIELTKIHNNTFPFWSAAMRDIGN